MSQKTDGYNLLVEEWIPVLTGSGEPRRVSIWTALTEAGRIRQVAASNPLDNVSLLRFLLAVLQWCKPTPSEAELGGLDGAPGVPEAWLEGRLGTPDAPNPIFNILGDGPRFYQDETLRSGRQRPVGDLLSEFPTETKVAHLRHVRDKEYGLCPACCAVGIVRHSAFATPSAHGNREQKPAGINGGTPAYGFWLHNSLLRDIRASWPLQRASGDAPSWEAVGLPKKAGAVGPLRGLTWRPRRVWLGPPSHVPKMAVCAACGNDHEDLIRRIAFLPGWGRPFGGKPWPDDPHLLYEERRARRGKRASVGPLSIPSPVKAGRALTSAWRSVCASAMRAESPSGSAPHTAMAGVAAVLAAAAQALYKDATALAQPSVPRGAEGRTNAALQFVEDATDQLEGLMRRSTPNPGRDHRELKAAVEAHSAGLETEVRMSLGGWLTGAARAGGGTPIAELAGHFQPLVRAVTGATTRGSPLRRREALRRVERALDSALREVEAKYADEGEEVSDDAD